MNHPYLNISTTSSYRGSCGSLVTGGRTDRTDRRALEIGFHIYPLVKETEKKYN